MSSGQRPSVAASNPQPPSTESALRGGGRAFGLGPRARVRVAAGALVVLVASVGVFSTNHNNSAALHLPSSKRSRARYGGLPSWLPKAKVPVNRVLRASRAHPALAIQGNTISAVLRSGRVLATAVGPEVPEEGRFPVPATSPCTFIVTFAAASGVIPLSAMAFTFIDEFDHVRHPRVTTMSGGPPPRRLLPGRTLSLKLYDILPTGDGGLSWSPDGARPIASWDFDVEID